jgi:hypothetical protein
MFKRRANPITRELVIQRFDCELTIFRPFPSRFVIAKTQNNWT